MTEQRKPSEYDQLAHLVECYLGLESMEATFELLELCGATLDVRALPRLKQRLQEEAAQIPLLHQRGYLRMREKCEQLVTSLRPLIATLEHRMQRRRAYDPTHDKALASQYRGPARQCPEKS